MKSIIIVGVLILVIAVILCWSDIYLNKTSGELLMKTEKTLAHIDAENWYQAMIEADETQHQWIETAGKYQYIVHHSEIDAISTALVRLDRYIAGRNKNDSLAEASVLRFLFEHLPKKDRLTGGNVF